MNDTPTVTDPTTWSLDREVVLVRLLAAPSDAVFTAWTDAGEFCQWFCPAGFTCTVPEMDVRPGGRAWCGAGASGMRWDQHPRGGS